MTLPKLVIYATSTTFSLSAIHQVISLSMVSLCILSLVQMTSERNEIPSIPPQATYTLQEDYVSLPRAVLLQWDSETMPLETKARRQSDCIDRFILACLTYFVAVFAAMVYFGISYWLIANLLCEEVDEHAIDFLNMNRIKALANCTLFNSSAVGREKEELEKEFIAAMTRISILSQLKQTSKDSTPTDVTDLVYNFTTINCAINATELSMVDKEPIKALISEKLFSTPLKLSSEKSIPTNIAYQLAGMLISVGSSLVVIVAHHTHQTVLYVPFLLVNGCALPTSLAHLFAFMQLQGQPDGDYSTLKNSIVLSRDEIFCL